MVTLSDTCMHLLEEGVKVVSLNFDCQDRRSQYYGKHVIMAHWSIPETPYQSITLGSSWDVFAQVLLAN